MIKICKELKILIPGTHPVMASKKVYLFGILVISEKRDFKHE
jgi:hypothetical protein